MIRVFHTLLFLLFLLSISVKPQQQNLQLEKFTIEDGLSSSGVFSIVQDKMGFLWIGTSTGLCRFDGNELVTLKFNNNRPIIISN